MNVPYQQKTLALCFGPTPYKGFVMHVILAVHHASDRAPPQLAVVKDVCQGSFMATFSVAEWVQAYQHGSSSVSMSQPEEVTCWTKTGAADGSRFLFGDRSGLHSYSRPRLPVDLNQGYPSTYTAKPDGEASPVDTIIQAAAAAAVDWTHFDVATYRNNMNKILLTPLQAKEGWQLGACFHEATGTLFLDIVPTPQNFTIPDHIQYYGYKFEAVCTGADVVDATSEFASVVTFRLGQLQLLMAAEIDAQQQQQQQPGSQGTPAPPLSYVEMKTYSIPRHKAGTQDMYAVKHPRWWVQSYLAGVPTMVLGGRDKAGTLSKVQEVAVQALPGLSARAGQAWDPQQLLAFGEAFLSWLKQLAATNAGQQLHCTFDPATRSISCEVVDGDMPDRLKQLLSE